MTPRKKEKKKEKKKKKKAVEGKEEEGEWRRRGTLVRLVSTYLQGPAAMTPEPSPNAVMN